MLALSKLPFVEVGDITQRIDAASLTVENKVSLCLTSRVMGLRCCCCSKPPLACSKPPFPAPSSQVQLTVPFSRTAFSTTASFEVRSPKRLQLRLTKGGIQTPELLTDMELPSNMTVLGQALDLSQLKAALSPINERVMGLLGQVGSSITAA